MGLLVLSAGSARAQSEDQIKAAFLFNFARYVEWPAGSFPEAASPIRICMGASVEFADIVSSVVAGKKVGDRPVAVVAKVEPGERTGCHILYLGDGESEDVPAIVASVSGGHVFTVADRSGFAAEGGVANFMRADKRVRFEINPGAAKRAGLKVSSRLLRLAKVVE